MSERYIDLNTVCGLTTLGKTSVYKLIGTGQFPALVKMGGATRWLRTGVDKWLEDRENERPLPADGERYDPKGDIVPVTEAEAA